MLFNNTVLILLLHTYLLYNTKMLFSIKLYGKKVEIINIYLDLRIQYDKIFRLKRTLDKNDLKCIRLIMKFFNRIKKRFISLSLSHS